MVKYYYKKKFGCKTILLLKIKNKCIGLCPQILYNRVKNICKNNDYSLFRYDCLIHRPLCAKCCSKLQ